MLPSSQLVVLLLAISAFATNSSDNETYLRLTNKVKTYQNVEANETQTLRTNAVKSFGASESKGTQKTMSVQGLEIKDQNEVNESVVKEQKDNGRENDLRNKIVISDQTLKKLEEGLYSINNKYYDETEESFEDSLEEPINGDLIIAQDTYRSTVETPDVETTVGEDKTDDTSEPGVETTVGEDGTDDTSEPGVETTVGEDGTDDTSEPGVETTVGEDETDDTSEPGVETTVGEDGTDDTSEPGVETTVGEDESDDTSEPGVETTVGEDETDDTSEPGVETTVGEDGTDDTSEPGVETTVGEDGTDDTSEPGVETTVGEDESDDTSTPDNETTKGEDETGYTSTSDVDTTEREDETKDTVTPDMETTIADGETDDTPIPDAETTLGEDDTDNTSIPDIETTKGEYETGDTSTLDAKTTTVREDETYDTTIVDIETTEGEDESEDTVTPNRQTTLGEDDTDPTVSSVSETTEKGTTEERGTSETDSILTTPGNTDQATDETPVSTSTDVILPTTNNTTEGITEPRVSTTTESSTDERPTVDISRDDGSRCLWARMNINISVEYETVTLNRIRRSVRVPRDADQAGTSCTQIVMSWPVTESRRIRRRRYAQTLEESGKNTAVVTLRDDERFSISGIAAHIILDMETFPDARYPGSTQTVSVHGLNLFESNTGNTIRCSTIKEIPGENGAIVLSDVELQVIQEGKTDTGKVEECELTSTDKPGDESDNTLVIVLGVLAGVACVAAVIFAGTTFTLMHKKRQSRRRSRLISSSDMS